MKLKKKDIITLTLSLIVIAAAVYFGFKLLSPSSSSKTTQSTNQTAQHKEDTITGQIDNETLSNIKKFKDYDEAKLDNIGRVNPFAPLN